MSGFGTKNRHKVGKLRHRAFLQQKVKPAAEPDSQDKRGRTNYEWVNVFAEQVPIGIEELFGGELDRARQLQANATHRITARYLPEFKRDMRLLIGTRELYIGNVENHEEMHRFVTIICEEKLA